jgi:hypothetical protein
MKQIALAATLCLGLARPAASAPIYLDDFEQFTEGADLTSAVYTPAVGGIDAARFKPHLDNTVPSSVTAVAHDGSIGAEFSLPEGSGEDYLGLFFTTYVETPLAFEWDFTARELNGGVGGFFIRFPTPTLDMQVLMGFLDDGRVIVFRGTPSPATLFTIGAYNADQTYRARLQLDLPADSYGVWLDGIPLLLDEPIPEQTNNSAIHQFGFDSNEKFIFPPGTFGNQFVIDNVQVTVDGEVAVPEPATLSLIGLGLGALTARRRVRSSHRKV